MIKTLVSLIAFAASAAPAPSVLVKVNGVPIQRETAMDRAWKEYGSAVLNEMADEILVEQAAKTLGVKADEKQVEDRLARIRGQFPDEATFNARLSATGTTLEKLKSDITQQTLREELVIKAKKLEVTEADAKAYFDANHDKLGNPEAYHLRHLEIASEKEAADLAVAINAGASFEKLAAKTSLDASTKDRGGDMGFVARGMLQPDIEKVIFALKPGQVSAPVKSGVDWHLFYAQEIRQASAAEYKNVKGALHQALLADKITKTWPQYLQELRNKAKYEPAGQ